MLPFSILALGGGGTKGILHVGAIQELEFRYGDLKKQSSKGIYGCSVGSIIATGIAFGMNAAQLKHIAMNLSDMSAVVNGEISMDILTKKGFCDMDDVETYILKMFDSQNIDLRRKLISDALIPLNIVASNLTKNVQTIFRGDVPVLIAIKASCCIPFLFRPQIIGASVYVDGGYLTNSLNKIIPSEDQNITLTLNIIHTNAKITPENLEDMEPLDYLYRLYKNCTLYERSQNLNPNSVDLYHSTATGFIDASKSEKEDMITIGKCLVRNFLTKRGY